MRRRFKLLASSDCSAGADFYFSLILPKQLATINQGTFDAAHMRLIRSNKQTGRRTDGVDILKLMKSINIEKYTVVLCAYAC